MAYSYTRYSVTAELKKDAFKGSLRQMLFEIFTKVIFSYLKIEYYIVLVKILLSVAHLFFLQWLLLIK